MYTKRPFAPGPRGIARASRASLLGVIILLVGCGAGAGNGNGGSSISVSITNKATSIQAGAAAVVFTATVQNDSSNSGVTWTLTANGTSCSPTCGTLSLATPSSVTYTPPSSGPAAPNNQPTLTATSVAKANKSDSDPFSITSALAVRITNKFASVNSGDSAFVINATVQNDPTNSGVSWALTVNGAACTPACGTLSGPTTTSVTYMPPTPYVSLVQPTLTAISVHDSSKSDTDSFVVNQPSITVVIQNKLTNVVAGAAGIFFAANVENDYNGSTSWTLTVNGTNCQPACGTLAAAGSQSITYNPPSSVPTAPNNSPTLTAISNTDSSKSDFDTLSITSAPPIKVTVSGIKSVVANSNDVGIAFSANVQNDFSNPPQGVTWTLLAGSSACSPICGSLSSNGATSVIYTAPTAVPSSPNDQPTLTATSVADPTTSDSDTFTITSTVTNGCSGAPSGSESLLNGHYALLMQGFEGGVSDTPLLIAASFAANGSGAISGGEEDINDTISPQHVTFDSTAGNSLYTVGADHRGCLQLTTTGGTTSVFRFALGEINAGVGSKGRVIEFDDNSGSGVRASGIFRRQDPNSFVLSALQSQYAFGVDGWGTEDNQFVHFNTAGWFSASGTANGVDDVNFAGITSPDSTGLQFTINPISPTTGWTTGSFDFFNWAIYMINSSEFFVISTDPITSTVSLGRAVATGASFTASSLSGNYVVHATGNANGSADANLQLLTMTPGGSQTGTLSGTMYSFGAGIGAQTTSLSGITYNIDPGAGRVTLGNPGDNLPILYLTTPTDGIAAFVVGAGVDALFGMADPQTSSALPAGTYIFGTEDPSDNTVPHRAGVESVATGGTFTCTYDQSTTSGLQSGQSVSGTASLNSNGAGNIGPKTVAITTGSKLFSIDEGGGTSGPAAIVVAEQ